MDVPTHSTGEPNLRPSGAMLLWISCTVYAHVFLEGIWLRLELLYSRALMPSVLGDSGKYFWKGSWLIIDTLTSIIGELLLFHVFIPLGISSVQFSSVTQSCLTFCDPMYGNTPGLPVHHQLLESTQTHVHWVGDVIQPSHPLSSPSPPAPNPSQH